MGEKKMESEPAPKRCLSSDIAAKYRYTVVEDLDEPTKFQMSELEYIGFLDGSKTYVNGKTMRERAKKLKAEFSLVDGIYMLEHQDKIPAEMRGKQYIVLSGTLLRGSGGRLRMACLYGDGSQWRLRFCWIKNDWCGCSRLPRRK